jgi:hypothetical protein
VRIKYGDAFYHIISRGERRETIFMCAADGDKFLTKVGETAAQEPSPKPSLSII